MKIGTKFAAVACGVCALLLVSSPSWAQGRRGGGGGGGGGGMMQQGPPGANGPGSPELQAYDKAVKALADIVGKAKGDFEKGKDWTGAEADVHQAQTDLDAAKKAAKDDLANDADYQQAQADKKQAQADLDAANASGSNSPDVITPIATKLMLAGTKISQEERAAADKNPGVVAAKDKLKAANAALDVLKQKFADSLKGNPDWVTAEKEVETAAAALPNPPKGAGPGGKATGGAPAGDASVGGGP